jgi:hypothetical protein
VGSPDGDNGQFSSGRLAYGCSNLATAWPHGGTGLGLVGELYVFPQARWKSLAAEETNSAVEVLWLGGDVVLSFTCMGWDNDAMAVVFPNTDQSSSQTVVKWPGSDLAPGVPVSTITNLVFTPWDTTNSKGLVVYKAAVIPDLNAQLAMSAQRFLETPAVAIAIPDGSDRLGAMGKFSELTL